MTMKVICEDGLTIDCTDFKAIDTGIVLIGGEEEHGAVGYVPNERLEYVLPDDVVALEHDRLGVPAPDIGSADELESRLGTFLDEIESLREGLDRQVEDLIDEDAVEDEDAERQDRLYERRWTITGRSNRSASAPSSSNNCHSQSSRPERKHRRRPVPIPAIPKKRQPKNRSASRPPQRRNPAHPR